MIEVKLVENEEEKTLISDKILRRLPQWFGMKVL